MPRSPGQPPPAHRRRRISNALTALALSTAAALVPSAPALAAAGSPVVAVDSGRCLDVTGRSQDDRAHVTIHDCNGGENQAWTLTAEGELRVYDAPKCLDVDGQATTAPAVVQIFTCNGGANQRWRAGPDGTLIGEQSGLCLDVTGAGTANGTAVGLWTCNGQGNQRWRVTGGADTQPPSVPGSPRVGNLVCDAATFSWDAATDDVGVAFYDVYHDGQLIKSVGGSTLSTDIAVLSGVTWGLYVNARDAAGNVSQGSATVRITPPQCESDTRPPTAPARLAGAASGTTITLTWSASTDDIGVRAYDVHRDGVRVGTVTGTATTAPATTFIDSALPPNMAHSYYVTARDAQSNVSARSNTATVTTGAACGSSVCSVRQVATDTDIPWGLATLPDGSILYTRRDAHDVVRLDPSTGVRTRVGTVPNVSGTDGEGGLLGLAVSPAFAEDRWVYLMHTSPTDNRIVRVRLDGDRLDTAGTQILLTGILRNKYHDGGRLRFGPDGKLYASTGDAQNGDHAQNRDSLNGKILRLNPDGSVPADNPFGNHVWSYGHRNPQGLAFDSQGRLWEQEFGNAVMDETNLIVKGGNYGWPACEGTSGACGTAGLVAPKQTYPTADGSCSGIAIVRDVLYVACQRGTRMYREVITGSSLTDVRAYFTGTYGRLRTVEPAPDGGLWLTTSNQGDKDSTPDNSDERILHITLGN
ncbi:PQQ-dependent sugar dehydrogenase [Actinoplanes sp. NPDC000266]